MVNSKVARQISSHIQEDDSKNNVKSFQTVKHDQTHSSRKISSADNSSLIKTKLSKSLSNDWSFMTRELVDTLPRIWTRGLLYFLMVFAGIILPWAMLSKVDETGSARGRLEPQGQVFTVDTPVAGTVANVLVEEGQLVQEQQPLLKLESEPIESEQRQVQTRLEGQKNELAQLKLLKNQLALTINTQKQQNQAQQLEKQAQIDQAQQNIQYSQKAKKLVETAYYKSMKEVQRYVKAKEQGIIAEIQVVEKEDKAQERKQLLEQANSDIEQAKLRLQEQQKSYSRLVHSGKIVLLESEEKLKGLETQIGNLISQIKQDGSQIDVLNYQLKQRVVKAPTSGLIFQLPIKKTGAVVNPGDLVAEIAPKQSSLILKAQMSTAQSGSLHKEMPVKIKFDAYPFQDYGIVEGKLVNISPTTKVADTENGQVAAYELEIELKQTYIKAKNKRIALRPGQTATAEVIVRQRRLIDFVLEPFEKLHEGGLEL